MISCIIGGIRKTFNRSKNDWLSLFLPPYSTFRQGSLDVVRVGSFGPWMLRRGPKCIWENSGKLDFTPKPRLDFTAQAAQASLWRGILSSHCMYTNRYSIRLRTIAVLARHDIVHGTWSLPCERRHHGGITTSVSEQKQ